MQVGKGPSYSGVMALVGLWLVDNCFGPSLNCFVLAVQVRYLYTGALSRSTEAFWRGEERNRRFGTDVNSDFGPGTSSPLQHFASNIAL